LIIFINLVSILLVSQNHFKLVYDYDCRKNKGDYLEIVCYLASKLVRFELCPVKDERTMLEIGDRRFSYEEFKRNFAEIEKLVDAELKQEQD